MTIPTKHHAHRVTCWHPILPAFAARIIIAFRTLVGIACVATFTLSPVTTRSVPGQLLLGVSFIVTIKSTLGATIQQARRLILGGTIAAVYCLIIITICPRNIYFSIGSTTLLVLLIVYTDLPVTTRRFTIVPTCIILLQWFDKAHINHLFVLKIVTMLSIGSTLAVVVTLIPIPVVPTAFRELKLRMTFIAQQTRRELTAIILLISEYHNKHLTDGYDYELNKRKQKIQTSDDNDNGIEMKKNSSVEDDIYSYSYSFEDLKDDHLLKSDVIDLHSIVNDELKQMQRALGEIKYEPYFIFFKFLNLIRRLLRHIPFIKKYIKAPSTLETRLSIWVTGLASIQRTIGGMLQLDHQHHHAFIGQRQLINTICVLLDSTFNFLDSTLPYTTDSTRDYNRAYTTACRAKVEEALEDFFETYTQVRDSSHHPTVSNTDAITLNTFLLLVLRLVHATITAAETSETPGSHIGANSNSTEKKPKAKKRFDWTKPCVDLAAYIGIRPSFGKLVRSIKTSLSVLVSAMVVFWFCKRLHAYGWIYWAPMTTALVSESSEGGTLRLSFQRLMAVLLGSTFAYVIVLITEDRIAVGVCICLFVGIMGYLKTDPRKEYFASVCGQSASIITFLSNQGGKISTSNNAVLARTSLTFIGIFIHVLISNIFLPITARALTKKKVSLMIKNVSTSLKSSTDDFCTFIEPTKKDQQKSSSNKSPFNLMKTLGETERIADSFPTLLEEALNEPNFWKRPFVQIKDRYDDISKSLRRISVDIRFVHRCTTILKAESKLHFAQEAKWLMRRTSLAQVSNGPDSKPMPAWTMTELRKEEQLQDDLDIPLTIFMTYSPNSSPTFEQKSLVLNNSSASLRLAHTTLYRPLLEHIRTLESHIQQVFSISRELIERQATVDVGSLELQQLFHEEDSYDDQSATPLTRQKRLVRGPSFYAVPQFEALPITTNYYKLFPCFAHSHKNNDPLPSLRNAVDAMFTSLVQFLSANNRFIRTEVVSNQTIGDVLAFHTLSFAFKDMVAAATNLAQNARRIKHIHTRTLIQSSRDGKSLQQQTV